MPSKRGGSIATSTTNATADVDDAAIRKRKQNRLSQQCLREKRSAGVANQSFFERLGADIRRLREVCEQQGGGGLGGGGGGGAGDGGVDVVAELVRINEGLIEENRCLREAVLRMRKKLLKDPVFQKILGKESDAPETTGGGAASNKRRKTSSSTGSGSASGRAVGYASSDADEPDRSERTALDEGEILANFPLEPSGSFNPLVAATSAPQASAMQAFHQQQHRPGDPLCMEFPPTTRPLPGQDFHTAPNFSFTSVPQISLTNTAILDAWMSRSYANLLTQKIENVCVQYVLKSRACKLDMGGGLGPLYQQFDERAIVDRLADIAVHMIFDDTGLGRFINVLEGAREFLRSAVACHIMLGSAKPHDIVDENVTDTPALTTSAKPAIVDLIAWPSLRDQMMFHSSFYDLDEMIEDVVNYCVADIPEQNLALQMYSTPPITYPHVTSPQDFESVKPFRFSEREFTHKMMQISNRDLFDIIAQRMEEPPCTAASIHAHSDMLRTSESECLPAKTEMARTFKGYRLSDAFFKKYPFLQCSSLASPYPFYPSSKIQGY
ncbi:hypothetical protein DBV05_g9651 [Lasiodiplodia theobromae]|uniref:BZIP domain-containing protein n=1 Tax=Lasiodiplodia theobromae TaxID=45133 RepID=A0A5N5D211_9PEZI|nr:hypothetical protein DBV05_g9651 [Lasiodiplodia theobromae]